MQSSASTTCWPRSQPREAAVILISSEFDEVARLAHRVLVMRAGRVVAEFDGRDVTEPALLRAAFGTAETVTADTGAKGTDER